MTQRGSMSRGAASKTLRPSRGGAGMIGAAKGVLSVAARRPGIVLASVAVVGGGGLFAWNATMKQSARHPAPLFAPASPATTASIAPEPPRRPDFAAVASPAPSRPETTAARAPETAGRPDSIGGLIKAGEPSPPRAAETKPGPQPRVVSAQKALLKLGYGPIAADGRIGTTTRQALEKFERDRKLPVTGALSPRTVKQLASLSGVSLD